MEKMKASELADALRKIISDYGDLQVGKSNPEFFCYDEINKILIIAREERDESHESLGEKFIGLYS